MTKGEASEYNTLSKKFEGRKVKKLPHILSHDTLYEAYPQLKTVGIEVIPYGPNVARAAYNKSINTIKIREDAYRRADELKRTLLHETQHAIQSIEGFERGGNKELALKIVRKEFAKFIDKIIVAPVTINGKKGIVGAVVKKTNGNRYKTHRIVMPDGTVFVFEKNKTEATTASMTNQKTGEGPAITPVLDNSISAEVAKNNTKYSLTDNQGRQLTKEQQEYFKDSKVRDENGNLLTVYHGSENKFNEFTSDINWFSSSKEYSDNYGKEANLFNKVTKTEPKKSKATFETHLNIKFLIWPKMNLFLLKLNRRRLNSKAVLPTSVKLYAKGARLQGCFPEGFICLGAGRTLALAFK